MIKKKQVEEKIEPSAESVEEDKVTAIEQAIEITANKLNKLYVKRANLEMDIESLVLSLALLQKELVNGE